MILTVLTIVAGTVLLMWIGDQMTEKGIGNGTSIIITVNIISALPGALIQAWKYFVTGEGVSKYHAIMMVVMIALLLIVIAATIAITQAPAQDRGAIRQARGRPQTVRRPDAVSSAQGQLRRRDADHLRLRGALAAADDAAVVLRRPAVGDQALRRARRRRHLVLHSRRHRHLPVLLLLGGHDVPALADRRGSQAQRRLHSRRAPRQADRGFPRLHDDPPDLRRRDFPDDPLPAARCSPARSSGFRRARWCCTSSAAPRCSSWWASCST